MVKLNKIYTRTGDAGTTGLVDGSRVSKADARMQAIGDVDEANSAIGFAIVGLDDADLRIALSRIQNDLFDLGADLATPGDDFTPTERALHVARAVSRRAERSAVTIGGGVNPQALIYLNRLSDFLFVACRKVNLGAGGDVLWVPGGAR